MKSVPVNTCKKGVNVFDVASSQFLKKLATHLKDKRLVTPKPYTSLVKCSYSNELAPIDPDWFYTKAAAVARQIYVSKSSTLGVGSLRRVFAKKARRGVNTNTTSLAGGRIMRDIVQQLRKAGFVEQYKSSEGATFGLLITKAGRSQMDKIAQALSKSG